STTPSRSPARTRVPAFASERGWKTPTAGDVATARWAPVPPDAPPAPDDPLVAPPAGAAVPGPLPLVAGLAARAPAVRVPLPVAECVPPPATAGVSGAAGSPSNPPGAWRCPACPGWARD